MTLKHESSLGQISFLDELKIKDWLQNDLHLSRAKIKNFELSKNFLEKNFKKKDALQLDLNILNCGIINPSYNGPLVDILFEDEKILVISKPFNTHLYPMLYSEKNTILNFLRFKGYGNSILNIASESHERGALYRLDFETSGVLIFAKQKNLYSSFFENRKKSSMSKIYLAVVENKSIENIKLTHFFEGLTKGGAKVKCFASDKENRVEGSIEVVKLQESRSENYMLLGVRLEEGHRHQIRAQLSTVGLPILGDVLYGGMPSDRLFLHAWSYKFNLEEKSSVYCDNSAKLFAELFDLNSCLEMLGNHFGI